MGADASCLGRRHVGVGQTKAAGAISALAAALDNARARIGHALAGFEQRRLAFGRRVFERSRHLGELMQTGTLPAGLRDSTLEQVITLTASVPGN